jgi:hypothetical protein
MKNSEIVTKQDLIDSLVKIVDEIQQIIDEKVTPKKKWLRSKDVREFLGGISNSKLQTLRINGTINYTKLGSSYYYDQEEISKILEENKQTNNEKGGAK